MKSKNKIITAVLLAAGTAAGTALINKYIKVSATSKKLLSHKTIRADIRKAILFDGESTRRSRSVVT